MNRYYYKIVDNIDFVWKVEAITNDPYKLNQLDFGHFVCDERQFIPYFFKNIDDIKKRNLFNGYEEILLNKLNENNCYFNSQVGLLHIDNYWQTLFAVRSVKCLNRMTPIIFGNSITDREISLYQQIMSINNNLGDEIYQTGYDYFKSLWEIDEYYSSTNIDTIQKFIKTLELQSVDLQDNKNNFCVYINFRPSWDEEHGLRIKIDFSNMEVSLTG